MKLNLIESLGKRGIITECKTLIKEHNEIDVGSEGVLALSATTPTGTVVKKGFKTNEGVVTINDYDIIQGISRIEFTRRDGVVFTCGELHRNGRFVHFKSNADELIVALSVAYLVQEKQIEKLSQEITEIKTRYGISII